MYRFPVRSTATEVAATSSDTANQPFPERVWPPAPATVVMIPFGVDLAHAVVEEVCDVEAAYAVEGDVEGTVERGLGRGAAASPL